MIFCNIFIHAFYSGNYRLFVDSLSPFACIKLILKLSGQFRFELGYKFKLFKELPLTFWHNNFIAEVQTVVNHFIR